MRVQAFWNSGGQVGETPRSAKWRLRIVTGATTLVQVTMKLTDSAAILLILVLSALARAQTLPATRPAGTDKMPAVHVDIVRHEVRVDCEALDTAAPLEFFCVINGGNEYEALFRTPAKPSHIHLGLLMLGLEPGEPIRYNKATEDWLPPKGPLLSITLEYAKDGKTLRIPATAVLRNIKTKQPVPPMKWVFVGSRFQQDGAYAADITGYVVSLANVELTLIDIPQLASRAWESLQWERNPDTAPPLGTRVTMIFQPADKTPATGPAVPVATERVDTH